MNFEYGIIPGVLFKRKNDHVICGKKYIISLTITESHWKTLQVNHCLQRVNPALQSTESFCDGGFSLVNYLVYHFKIMQIDACDVISNFGMAMLMYVLS